MKLDAYLRAHSFLKVERPPELWEADVDESAFIRLTGEMIAAGLARGNVPAELTLNVSNVVVEESAADDRLAQGEYIALTIRGPGRWKDATWRPGSDPVTGSLRSVEGAARDAGCPLVYSRDLGEAGGSVTALIPRLKG